MAALAGADVGADVELSEVGDPGEGWSEAGTNAGHPEGHYGDPGLVVECVDLERIGEQGLDHGRLDWPVSEEQITPPLSHDPGARLEGPGTVIGLPDDFSESHNSRLSLVKGLETEIKIEVLSFRGFRKRLKEAGFRIKHRRVFERNTIFETSPPSLRPKGCLVRLREAGSKFTITYKGPATVGKHKSREEVEFIVSDADAAYTFLTRLGYLPGFVYEKYRTEYAEIDSSGVVTLDETPIGIYAELEGEEKWIDFTAKTLGIADTEYLTASYGALYLKWCEREGLDPGHMRFT